MLNVNYLHDNSIITSLNRIIKISLPFFNVHIWVLSKINEQLSIKENWQYFLKKISTWTTIYLTIRRIVTSHTHINSALWQLNVYHFNLSIKKIPRKNVQFYLVKNIIVKKKSADLSEILFSNILSINREKRN